MDHNTQTDEYGFARAYFLPDEYERWRGKSKGISPTKNLTMIPFGVFYLAFALFWTISASSAGGFFGVFGLPFIAVGMYRCLGKI